MILPDEVQRRIDSYLGKLRRNLRRVKTEDVEEIVEELRSHIIDRAAGEGEATVAAVEIALASLGSPEELATQYMTDSLLQRAAISRSPFRVLQSLFRWASLSVIGFPALLGAIAGYGFGVLFLLCAVLKPFHPGTAGLWLIADAAGDVVISLRMGFGSAPAGGRELLGWWIVPLGLAAGCALVTLTTRLSLWFAERRQERGAIG
jgi:uncharacterized membrane protein